MTEKRQTSQGYIIRILQHFATKLRNITNFVMLFQAVSIDVLIGSDYYWDIIMSESIRADYGPTAINSKFGWVLSGPVTNSLFSVDNTASHSHVPNHLRSIGIPTISK